jgi:membrane protease YdiL (CAAX protease family)
MLHTLSILAGFILAVFVVWEVVKTYRDYPKFKQALAQGDPQARPRFYMSILRFEWISALLALVALGFDRAKMTAAPLQMGDTAFAHWLSTSQLTGSVGIGALTGGLILGLVLMSVLRLRARRSAPPPAENQAKPWWRKLVPDVMPLIPTTARERWLFVAVAISAGICEEIVFRGWLLFTLHMPFGLSGTALIVLASLLFGLCHIYQGPTGVFGATLAGALLAALYIATGTLLVPIVLHSLIDLRVALLPSSSPRVPQAQMQKEPA